MNTRKPVEQKIMKKYLSFGGGVNSVAMMLMLLDQGDDFEAIFVDHGTDWPETYEYTEMLQNWLKDRGHKSIKILKPNLFRKKDGRTFDSLYDYAFFYKMIASRMFRWCTAEFKVKPIHRYVKTPCFMYIGIDYGESHRAKISTQSGIENRYPLIEHGINRSGCEKIIKDHGLAVPMKSGCYICPFQPNGQWIELRKKHPELFCKAQQLEINAANHRIKRGKKPISIKSKSLKSIVDEDQMNLFEQDDYPPCQCGL
jgi:hypothetical protein